MSSGRILVVDDEPQIRRVLRATLTGHGYEFYEARSGEEALEAIRANRFDLILLDVNMQGMGGLEACRAIRSPCRPSTSRRSRPRPSSWPWASPSRRPGRARTWRRRSPR